MSTSLAQFRPALGRWTFDLVDSVLCYTDRDRVRDLGVRSRIEVVHNGIDTERFTPEGAESDLLDHDGPVVLFVGRLVEGKRPATAVRALAALRETHPDAALYLCGEGPLRTELADLAEELGVGDAVTFCGHVPYDAMPAVYRGADAFVLSSRAEGVPRTIMEAMATGVPVVASDLPQIRGLVSSGGYTVAKGNVEGFATRLGQCLDGEYPDGGRERIVEEHSWADTVERTTKALERIGRR